MNGKVFCPYCKSDRFITSFWRATTRFYCTFCQQSFITVSWSPQPIRAPDAQSVENAKKGGDA